MSDRVSVRPARAVVALIALSGAVAIGSGAVAEEAGRSASGIEVVELPRGSTTGSDGIVVVPGSTGTGITDPEPSGPLSGRPQPNSAESVIGADGRTQVTNTTAYPSRAIGQIELSYNGFDTFICTGWLVDPNTVVTAGHCVYNHDPDYTVGPIDWATFHPGRNGAVDHYGSCNAVAVYYPTEWSADEAWQHDWGMIDLDCTIGTTTGWFGVAAVPGKNELAGTAIAVSGYPGDKASGTHWQMSGSVYESTNLTVHYELDTAGGQSGSPIIATGGVPGSLCDPACSIGIHAYGAGGDPLTNSGTRITSSRLTKIRQVALANDAPAAVGAFGSGGSGDGQLAGPLGVAVAADGSIYVADTDNNRIQRFSATGTFVTAWGTAGSGDGQFDEPRGVAVDSAGNVYVVDAGNNRIQAFTASGTFVRTWGSTGSGAGQFSGPWDIAIGPEDTVYVTDTGNHRIQTFTTTGASIGSWGSAGSGAGQFNGPRGLDVADDGTVVVADTGNNRVQTFTASGVSTGSVGSLGSEPGQFDGPWDVAVGADDRILVADTSNARVQIVTASAGYVTEWGGTAPPAVAYTALAAIAVSPDGTVITLDAVRNRVEFFGDDDAPTITIRRPAVGAVYPRGARVRADFACSDVARSSGVERCDGTVADGARLSTSSTGVRTVTVLATDRARNTTVVERSYSVALARPDVRAKAGRGRVVGNDTYAPTRQTVTDSARPGRSVRYTVTVENDTGFADRFRVKGAGSKSGFTVTYRNTSGRRITADVVDGTFRTPRLEPGQTFRIDVSVAVGDSVPAGTSLTRTVTARSTTHRTETDTIRLVTARS